MGGERGLLGLDFHQDFASNGKFYVNYTAAGSSPFAPGATVIVEYEADGMNLNVANTGSERIVLTVTQDFGNHNGGDIHFSPDGYLYIGMGDGGGGNGACDRSQTLDPDQLKALSKCGSEASSLHDSMALLGKMLRIDVDNTTPAGTPAGINQLCGANDDGSAAYAIPADNPFFGVDFCSGEVWLAREDSPGVWSAEVATAAAPMPLGFGLVAIGEDEQGNVYLVHQSQGVWRFEGDRETLLQDGFEDAF